jgi:hypothetical protein
MEKTIKKSVANEIPDAIKNIYKHISVWQYQQRPVAREQKEKSDRSGAHDANGDDETAPAV